MIQIKNSNINSHNTITNSHNTNNTNNITIKINPFGQENTDFLTKKEKLKINSVQEKIYNQFKGVGPLSFLKSLTIAKMNNPYRGRKII